jgi:two-component system, LytTR family, response regulator
MRTLIVDAEAPARAKLRRFLSMSAGVEIVGEAATGREAVAAIKRTRPDIVFLDIQMPGLDGFGVVDAIERDGAPYIVFVTADDSSAIRAFEVGAVDYLLKPFTPGRFDRVLERARERMSTSTSAQANAAPPPTSFLQRIFVSANGRAMFLPVERIDRAYAERNYVVLAGGQDRYRLRATIGSLASRLDPSQFLRVNRSTLIRLDAVREMHEWSHGDMRVVMNDGAELMWSRRYRTQGEAAFGVGG